MIHLFKGFDFIQTCIPWRRVGTAATNHQELNTWNDGLPVILLNLPWFHLFQVNVYFATMKMENIVESPEINWAEFRNSLGGALALYLGISFVSFFEVVEFIVRTFLGMFIYKADDRRSSSIKPFVKIMQEKRFSS